MRVSAMENRELTRHDVEKICIISKETVGKQFAILDLNHMLQSLHEKDIPGIFITVGSRKFSVSKDEIHEVEVLLMKCMTHLEKDILDRKDQIVQIVTKTEEGADNENCGN